MDCFIPLVYTYAYAVLYSLDDYNFIVSFDIGKYV